MEGYCYQYLSNGNYSTKEKRPPLKRGQLKRRIVRTISNLLVPSNDNDRKFRFQKRTKQQLFFFFLENVHSTYFITGMLVFSPLKTRLLLINGEGGDPAHKLFASSLGFEALGVENNKVCFGSSDDSAYKYSQAPSYFPSSSVHLASKHTHIRTAREDEEARRSYYYCSVMEYCYQYSASSSNNSNMVKEKRPPTKRGHVKVQIARKLSNLVLPRSAGGDAN
ncbi:hypothetical protein PR202_ga05389 [Eleusine coracana subsp. coracana]|uniref:Uncharacterized protein n=1 Tax=Eleusine coracana subsp. coracana TaxID=191504 RepID=A0AAV5BTC6_ELECO|nr:hypothetical protein PR202_ga04936 [Eleusine coracana subsp. coracana]GJM89222.1 hypothetical protein PR202_ga05389 [Eleusine coracana subsp. coracana]